MKTTEIFVDGNKLTIIAKDKKNITLSTSKGKAQTFKLKELSSMSFYNDLIQWLYYGQNIAGRKYKFQKYIDKFAKRK